LPHPGYEGGRLVRDKWPYGILTGAAAPSILWAHTKAAIERDDHDAVVSDS
jgi:hypothetical protein